MTVHTGEMLEDIMTKTHYGTGPDGDDERSAVVAMLKSVLDHISRADSVVEKRRVITVIRQHAADLVDVAFDS